MNKKTVLTTFANSAKIGEPEQHIDDNYNKPFRAMLFRHAREGFFYARIKRGFLMARVTVAFSLLLSLASLANAQTQAQAQAEKDRCELWEGRATDYKGQAENSRLSALAMLELAIMDPNSDPAEIIAGLADMDEGELEETIGDVGGQGGDVAYGMAEADYQGGNTEWANSFWAAAHDRYKAAADNYIVAKVDYTGAKSRYNAAYDHFEAALSY